MAQTNITTASTLARIRFVSKEIKSATKGAIWEALKGTSEDSIIQVIGGLEKKGAGYKIEGIHIHTGEPSAGTSGTNSTEWGQEEAISPYTDTLELEFYQKGYDLGHKFQEQYLTIDLMKASSGRFKRWLENLINDKLMADLLTSPADTLWPSTIASEAISAIDSDDVLIVNDISKWTAIVEDGDNGSYEPFRGADVLGETGMFALVTHPRSSSMLKQTSAWQTIWQNAQVRGNNNPLWRGYVRKPIVGEYDNMAIIASRRVPYFTNGGAGADVPYSTGVICGAQAGLYGEGMITDAEKKEYVDPTGVLRKVYRNIIFGSKATTFNSTQYGSVQVNLAAD